MFKNSPRHYGSVLPFRRLFCRGQRAAIWVRAVFSVLLAATGVALIAPAASAATLTAVSLSFDNNTVSEYTLGYQNALQPAGVNGTFYINSGTIGSSAKFMSWSQVSSIAAGGSEIGGKTVDGINLTTLSAQQQINEICNDRQNIMSHGTTPITFAYPAGASNSTIQSEAQGCGYGNARTAGSLTPSGPYAETLPPKNWLALRAYAPSGQVTLANLESLVSGAASHGGGWIPIVIQRVCSATLDQANYSTCTSSAGWVRPGRSADLHLVGAERRAGKRRAGRNNVPGDGSHGEVSGHRRAHHHHLLQRVTVPVVHLQPDGQRDPVRDRPGFGGGQHALHHRRQHSHPVQPGLHRAVPADLLRHGPVPLLGQRRERRGGALPGGLGAAER